MVHLFFLSKQIFILMTNALLLREEVYLAIWVIRKGSECHVVILISPLLTTNQHFLQHMHNTFVQPFCQSKITQFFFLIHNNNNNNNNKNWTILNLKFGKFTSIVFHFCIRISINHIDMINPLVPQPNAWSLILIIVKKNSP